MYLLHALDIISFIDNETIFFAIVSNKVILLFVNFNIVSNYNIDQRIFSIKQRDKHFVSFFFARQLLLRILFQYEDTLLFQKNVEFSIQILIVSLLFTSLVGPFHVNNIVHILLCVWCRGCEIVFH